MAATSYPRSWKYAGHFLRSARGRLWLSMAPLRIGSRPVSSAARLGAQLGDATKACVNVIPSAASRAMFGVGTSFPP